MVLSEKEWIVHGGASPFKNSMENVVRQFVFLFIILCIAFTA